jgi:hypothetical protein
LDILDAIQEEYRYARVPHCQASQSQRIKLGRGIHAVVFDPEVLAHSHSLTGKRCDCIVLFHYQGRLCVAIIELKSASIDMSQIFEQFRNCHQMAQRMLAGCGASTCILHLLVSEGGWGQQEKKELGQWNDKKRRPFRIVTCRYDQQLVALFRKAAS